MIRTEKVVFLNHSFLELIMELKEFRRFFSDVARNFNIALLAKHREISKNFIHVKDDIQVFDALELLKKYEGLVTEEKLVVIKEDAMERPVRILFFMLIEEVEYSIYKILKQYTESIENLEKLRSIYLNELIREFFALSDIFEMQKVYSKRQEMKRDLKAVSSFRNILMHSNRKMELETEFNLILKRKEQIFRLLDALEEIIEKLKVKMGVWK